MGDTCRYTVQTVKPQRYNQIKVTLLGLRKQSTFNDHVTACNQFSAIASA